MKKILIIAPHYPPSNLAGVHRSRLFAQHLPSFGWEPIILTVDESYYEEALDWNLHRLLPQGQRIEKVKAFPVTKPRLIGDVGLRAFYQLRKKALEIVQKENVHFVYIPIPSFYASLIGPYLHKKTGIKYGIDYIDPWVHRFPGYEKTFSRHWWSTKLSGFLETLAVRKASLITGVAEGYYKGVQERNPDLAKACLFGAMPYGGEPADHARVKELRTKPYLFQKKEGKTQMIYAGALLPKAYRPLEAIFRSIAANSEQFDDIEIHFVGTGSRANDETSYTVKPLAKQYGLYNRIVFEYPKRIPYLDVLIHLQAADGVFILGSTEPHYSPSKVYQGILSDKLVLAVLHRDSTAVDILKTSGAGVVLAFDGEAGMVKVEHEFCREVWNWRLKQRNFKASQVDHSALSQYTARSVTHRLVALLEQAIEYKTNY